MSTVVLVRPGCTDFDEQKRLQGCLELPLNNRGQNQLTRIVEALKSLPIEAVLTGPCEPCLSTAKAVAAAMHVKLIEKEELCNLDHGLWQGMNVDEIRRKFPRAYKQWEDAPETVCPPEGETVNEVLDRIISALKKPLRKYDTFAVIASEPLASLISCSLRGEAPDDVCGSLFNCCDDHLIDVIQTDAEPEGNSILSLAMPLL